MADDCLDLDTPYFVEDNELKNVTPQTITKEYKPLKSIEQDIDTDDDGEDDFKVVINKVQLSNLSDTDIIEYLTKDIQASEELKRLKEKVIKYQDVMTIPITIMYD